MIKHKIILIFTLIFCMIVTNSCGGSSQTEFPDPESDIILDDNIEEIEGSEEETPPSDNGSQILNNNSEYQEGDMHLNELNLQIKKLQAELDHYKSNLRELSAKSQVWGNPFTVYNKEIILTNGTTVFGKIVYQDRDVVKVETLIGK